MSLGKKNIVKNIVKESKFTSSQAISLIDSFLSLVITKSQAKKNVKLRM